MGGLRTLRLGWLLGVVDASTVQGVPPQHGRTWGEPRDFAKPGMHVSYGSHRGGPNGIRAVVGLDLTFSIRGVAIRHCEQSLNRSGQEVPPDLD